MKRERPIRIWLAGVPWRASAERTKESTITIRVKLVIRRMIEGASVRSVIANRILIAESTSWGCCAASTPRLNLNGTSGAPVAVGCAVTCPNATNEQESATSAPNKRREKHLCTLFATQVLQMCCLEQYRHDAVF